MRDRRRILCRFFRCSALALKKHALCLLPHGLYHRTYTETPHVRKLAVQFDYRCTQLAKDSVYRHFHEAVTAVKTPILLDGTEICALFEKIRAEFRGDRVASAEMRQSLMCQMYITVLRLLRVEAAEKSQSGGTDSREIRYKQIEDFLCARYNQPVTTEDLAGEMGLSRRQTDRIVADIYGMTFREKLVDLRMTQALHFLTTTDLPVETIAEQIGYRSLSGFFTAFRSRFGISASEYRRSLAGAFESETSFS